MKYLPYPNRTTLEDHLIERIIKNLKAGLAERDQALMVLSGGSTPAPLFRGLSRAILPWHKIIVTLADERWVSPTDPRSNERLVRECLLADKAAAARFLGLKTTHATPAEGQHLLSDRLKALPWPADVVLLGMGADGHFASLFPDSQNFLSAMTDCRQQRCFAIDSSLAGTARMSLSLPTLLETNFLALQIVGSEKYNALNRAQKCSSIVEMPVKALLQQKVTPLEVFLAP
jgi:6-phosphogluconolactonase